MGEEAAYPAARQWTYRIDLKRNRDMLWLIIKVFSICYAFFPVMSVIVSLAQGSFDLWALLVPVLAGLFLDLVIVFSWFLYAAISGGYWVMLSVDENGVDHWRIDKTGDRLQLLAALLANGPGAMTAAAAGSVTRHWHTDFAAVRSVVIDRKHDRIGVNGSQNVPVYAEAEDYNRVLNDILARVPLGTRVVER